VIETVDSDPWVDRYTDSTTGDIVSDITFVGLQRDFSDGEELSESHGGIIASYTHPDTGVITNNLAFVTSTFNNRLDIEVSETRSSRR